MQDRQSNNRLSGHPVKPEGCHPDSGLDANDHLVYQLQRAEQFLEDLGEIHRPADWFDERKERQLDFDLENAKCKLSSKNPAEQLQGIEYLRIEAGACNHLDIADLRRMAKSDPVIEVRNAAALAADYIESELDRYLQKARRWTSG